MKAEFDEDLEDGNLIQVNSSGEIQNWTVMEADKIVKTLVRNGDAV